MTSWVDADAQRLPAVRKHGNKNQDLSETCLEHPRPMGSWGALGRICLCVLQGSAGAHGPHLPPPPPEWPHLPAPSRGWRGRRGWTLPGVSAGAGPCSRWAGFTCGGQTWRGLGSPGLSGEMAGGQHLGMSRSRGGQLWAPETPRSSGRQAARAQGLRPVGPQVHTCRVAWPDGSSESPCPGLVGASGALVGGGRRAGVPWTREETGPRSQSAGSLWSETPGGWEGSQGGRGGSQRLQALEPTGPSPHSPRLHRAGPGGGAAGGDSAPGEGDGGPRRGRCTPGKSSLAGTVHYREGEGGPVGDSAPWRWGQDPGGDGAPQRWGGGPAGNSAPRRGGAGRAQCTPGTGTGAWWRQCTPETGTGVAWTPRLCTSPRYGVQAGQPEGP